MASAIYRRAAGNIGAAVTKFLAPFVLLAWGWQTVAQAWAVALVVMAVVFWFTTDDDPAIRQRHAGAETPKGFLAEFAPLKNQQVWRFAPPELVTPTVRASETDRPRGHRNRCAHCGSSGSLPLRIEVLYVGRQWRVCRKREAGDEMLPNEQLPLWLER
jgi:hypothetical protein